MQHSSVYLHLKADKGNIANETFLLSVFATAKTLEYYYSSSTQAGLHGQAQTR